VPPHNFDEREQAFLEQKDVFLAEALAGLGYANLNDVPDVTGRHPVAISPVLVQDYRRLTSDEITAMSNAFWGENGVAHFIVLNPKEQGKYSHPLLEIASQLADNIPLKYPVMHPMEGHREAILRFGPADGTLKIYNLETRDGSSGYRERAETAEMFDAHNDGLGYGGSVEVFALYADSGPLWGGYTYFQNVVRLSLRLALTDPDALASLFLRTQSPRCNRGKGAIKVTSPALFVNEHGRPQVFLRVQTGEYRITWRSGIPALDRAAAFLNHHAKPFAPGSTFIHLDRCGAGCLARNGWLVHGRTPFIDGTGPSERRVLARKWFMSAPEHARYKHVPGMHILDRFASIYPERFGPEFLVGDCNFDPAAGTNVRKS
jgi:hypothetical protein